METAAAGDEHVPARRLCRCRGAHALGDWL